MLRCWHPRVKIGADPIRKMPAKSLGPFQALVAGALEQSLHLDTVHEARSAAGLANLEMCIGRQAQLMYVGLGICDVPLRDIECLVVPHGIFAEDEELIRSVTLKLEACRTQQVLRVALARPLRPRIQHLPARVRLGPTMDEVRASEFGASPCLGLAAERPSECRTLAMPIFQPSRSRSRRRDSRARDAGRRRSPPRRRSRSRSPLPRGRSPPRRRSPPPRGRDSRARRTPSPRRRTPSPPRKRSPPPASDPPRARDRSPGAGGGSGGDGAAAGGGDARIHEETIGGRTKYRARLPCGSLVIQGPLRNIRDTSEQDLVKMEAAWSSDGLSGVQKLQPELFRIREPRAPNRR
eukprot:s235_g7.t1